VEVEEGMEEGKGSKFEPCWDLLRQGCTEAKGDLIRPGFEK